MPEHILISYASRRPHQDVPSVPDNAIYDHEKGYWLRNNKPWMISSEFAQDRPVTKKADMETGEDLKGI